MSEGEARLPGFWRFLWLYFMQPITLHRMLVRLGIDPSDPGWKLLRRPRSAPEKWWITRLAQILLLFGPVAALSIISGAVSGRHPLDWLAFLCGVVVILGLSMGLTAYATQFVVLGMAFGLMGLATAGPATGWAEATFLLVWALSPPSFAAARVVESEEVWYGGLFYFLVALVRAPLNLAEESLQVLLRLWSALAGQSTLRFAPVLYDELSFLPLPFLESQLLAEAEVDPALTRRVLDACSIAPGQRRVGRRVESVLRARELKRLAQAGDFAAVQELRGVWLPGVAGADPVLLGFSEAARYLAAAATAFNPHHRLKHLRGFDDRINALENQLRSQRDGLTQPFEETLNALREAGGKMRVEAEKAAEGLVPNPFRAGDPLSDEEGPELFRGREIAIRDIENTLADATRSASLQLLAPRRAGKTSLLKMLPRMLPDTICVFFDVQAHPVSSVAAFWNKLAEQAIIQAKRDRRVDLPKFPDGPPMEAAAQWLEKLDGLPQGRRVLIAIDEFERIEELFPGSRQEFLQLMGLFRATIQHRRGVRLLVSGAAPFDELDRVWDDHFISARQIKLPFLSEADSVDLLTQPAPDFPHGAIPEVVACEVYRQTTGQPFLLQVYGSLLVTRLNDERRKTAVVEDVKAVEERAMEWAEPYFRDTYKQASPATRAVLGLMATGKAAQTSPAIRRWLTQRYLLTPDGQLAIPLFTGWMSHHGLDEESPTADRVALV